MKEEAMSGGSTSRKLVAAAATLRDEADVLRFGPPVAGVYNPLRYAWAPHETYLRRFGDSHKKTLFVGMNPGPFGMAQTGVPFGEVAAVRHWLGIENQVDKPVNEHPARPVTGFACKRSEVSGRRLWGLFAARFKDAGEFFAEHFVVNYCPLAFLEQTGRNRTPEQLSPAEQVLLHGCCDRHLRAVVVALQPRHLVGVGGFALKRLRVLFGKDGFNIGTILHPSPASPAANRGWDAVATRQLRELGVW